MRIDLLVKQPDTVCFLMDAPLDLKYLWDVPSLASVDKISLWFDDYYRSPKTLAHPETWINWQKNHGVRVGIWDGYWRCQWKRLTGVEAFPIHLAADPRLLRPHAESWNRAWNERAAFIGTVPSLKSLDTFAQAFPAPLRRFLEEICIAMQRQPWPIKPYEVVQKCRSFMGEKYGRAVDAMLKDPATQALWNHLIWRWGKRIAPPAGVERGGPGRPTGDHERAWNRKLMPVKTNCAPRCPRGPIWPTPTLEPCRLRHGKVFSARASGSCRSWIPNLSREVSLSGFLSAAACGVPLLSDHRPELAALFPPESGLVTAANETALQESASQLFQTSKRDLEARGQLLHQAFLAQHTWEIRWRQLVQGYEYRSAATRFESAPEQPAPAPESLMPQAA